MFPDPEDPSSPRHRTKRLPSATKNRCQGGHILIQAHESAPSLLGYLGRRVTVPHSLLHRWIRTGQVLVNGTRVHPQTGVSAGDVVRLPSRLGGGRGGAER